MQLHWSPRSPYVRKVMIAAHELGLTQHIKCVRSVAAMDAPNPAIMADNPLNKIPTLILDSGMRLYDSMVICEYFDMIAGGNLLFPLDQDARLLALRRHALGNGLLDLSIIRRNERDRPVERQSPAHLAAFQLKTEAALAALEREADALERDTFSIGHIAIGCALSYLDFRFSNEPWRGTHPHLAHWHHLGFEVRPSAKATLPVDA